MRRDRAATSRRHLADRVGPARLPRRGRCARTAAAARGRGRPAARHGPRAPLRAVPRRTPGHARARAGRGTTSRRSTTSAAAASTSPTTRTATPASAAWRCCAFKHAYRRRRPRARRRRAARPPRRRARVRRDRRPDGGRQLLLDHRAGIELLRLGARGRRLAVRRRARAPSPPPCRRCAATSARPSHRLAARGPARRGGRPRTVRAAGVHAGAPSRRAVRLTERPPMTAPQLADVGTSTRCCGSSSPTSASPCSSSGTSGATATTSSAGPPGRPSSTRTGCCAWAARCSTSASCSSSLGHVMGLGVPKSWTEAVGVTEGMYHASAVGVGSRRRRLHRGRHGDPDLPPPHRRPGVLRHHPHGQGDVRSSSAPSSCSAWPTPSSPTSSAHYDYRDGVSVWFRGIFRLDPHPELMAAAPIGFQLHALAAFALFALWPFTRLVHVFSAPLGYLTRPYIVYRSRDDQPRQPQAAPRLGAGGVVTSVLDDSPPRAREPATGRNAVAGGTAGRRSGGSAGTGPPAPRRRAGSRPGGRPRCARTTCRHPTTPRWTGGPCQEHLRGESSPTTRPAGSPPSAFARDSARVSPPVPPSPTARTPCCRWRTRSVTANESDQPMAERRGQRRGPTSAPEARRHAVVTCCWPPERSSLRRCSASRLPPAMTTCSWSAPARLTCSSWATSSSTPASPALAGRGMRWDRNFRDGWQLSALPLGASTGCQTPLRRSPREWAAVTPMWSLTTGGTSVGAFDHVHGALNEVGGRLLVDGVDVKPGHPMLLASLPGDRWLVGLPGNPLAACVALLTLLEPLLGALHGLPRRTAEHGAAGRGRAGT